MCVFKFSVTHEGDWGIGLATKWGHSMGSSSASAALNRSSTSCFRLVSSPPRQMKTAARIPHKNEQGISVPIVQGGRSKLCSLNLVFFL